MTLARLEFVPGINREGTDYDGGTSWYDCNKVRFRQGKPERIGGWEKKSINTFVGTCRILHPWTLLDSENLIGVGTHLKFYLERGGEFNDITPIRTTVTLGSNPLAVASGSNVVTVTHTSHGAGEDDFVTYSGATGPIGGIAASEFNDDHQITIVDGNSYTITVTSNGSSSASGGGGSVSAAYQILTGLDSALRGLGWGAGTWSSDGWGDPASSLVTSSDTLRLWSVDNFGEDLLFNVRNGAIYYWDAGTGVTTRAVALVDVSGASDVPTVAREILVAQEERFLIALGCNALGSAVQDLMLIRFADTESVVDWTPDTTNNSGSLRLNNGSEIITGIRTKRGILVWTDTSLNSIQFVGRPSFFGTSVVATNVKIMGPRVAIEADNVVYWMGKDNFYRYDGTASTLPCSVRSYVFDNLNSSQSEKFFSGINTADQEVIWFYCSASSDDTDSYVIYNYEQNLWYFGTMERTAWVDRSFEDYPMATARDGSIYYQEKGYDDGESSPAAAISAHIESADFELGTGDRFQFIRRIIPDVTFEGSEVSSPAVTITLTPRSFPGETLGTTGTGTVTRTSTTPVEVYTTQAHVRIRGRVAKYKISSSATGVFWRDGTPRIDIRPDGRR